MRKNRLVGQELAKLASRNALVVPRILTWLRDGLIMQCRNASAITFVLGCHALHNDPNSFSFWRFFFSTFFGEQKFSTGVILVSR